MLPFLDAQEWRRVFLGLFAFPALLLSTVLRMMGVRTRADTLENQLRRAWLRQESGTALVRPWWQRLVALVFSAMVLIVTAYLLVGIVINFAYPLRPDNEVSDWGGPSLAGRWLVHAAGGVMFFVLTPWIGRGLQALARRLF